jgi:hypothetical protein
MAAAGAGTEQITLMDDCDPDDPGWAPPPGCLHAKGSVSNAEFNLFRLSPLVGAGAVIVGHPSWRIEPGYVAVGLGDKLKITNLGGRPHTFTEVTNYGGGVVPPLNVGLAQATECLAAATIAPGGGKGEIPGLALGNHKFQCCFHPWMRAAVKVVTKE